MAGKNKTRIRMFSIFIVVILIWNLLFLVVIAGAAQTPLKLQIDKVESADFPKVSIFISFSQALKSKLGKDSFSLFENGRKVEKISVQPRDPAKQPVYSVLIIDVSGSMKGKPFEEAKKAAKVFISRMKSGDKAAIVQFSDKTSVLSHLTGEKDKLFKAIDSLRAGGNTALFDGVVTGLNVLKDSDSVEKVTVLLSDGEDNVSKASYNDCLKAAKSSGVSIYTVGLGRVGPPVEKLNSLAKETGGKFLNAPSEESLVSLYDNLAGEIYNRYLITFESQSKSGEQIRLKLMASIDGAKVKANTLLKIEKKAAEKPAKLRLPKVPLQRAPLSLLMVISLILLFGAVSLFFYSVLSFFMISSNPAIKQLKVYERAWRSHPDIREKAPENLRGKILAFINILVTRHGIQDALSERIEAAGLSLRVSEFVFFHLSGLLLLGLIGNSIAGIPGMILLILAGAFVPFVYMDVLKGKRQMKFEEQLPEALVMIAYSLRAGYSLLQSIDLASLELANPISNEFRRVVKEIRLGLSVEEALGNMARRVKNQSLDWTVTAMNIQKEVGGNLAELLEKIAETLRQRQSFRRYVNALSAEGRVSAYILIALPFFETAVLYIIAPGYISLLFRTQIGLILVLVALLLMSAGWLWMRRITAIEL